MQIYVFFSDATNTTSDELLNLAHRAKGTHVELPVAVKITFNQSVVPLDYRFLVMSFLLGLEQVKQS